MLKGLSVKRFWVIALAVCCGIITGGIMARPATQFNVQQQAVDSLLRNTFSDTLPGISVAIMYNNKPVFKHSYGISNTSTHQPLTDSSNFNICSLTKQFTALAILNLQQQRRLSVNDTISKYFTGMNSKVADALTIRMLLTHCSGIIDHYNYTNTANMQHAHNADVYAAIKNVDSTYFEPGTKFRYSNTAYCLLALIIEKVSGMSYNDYMLQHVFARAGMHHTTIWNEASDISNEVTGYTYDSATASFHRSGADESIFFSTEGDGGIYTSVNDYLHWFTALQQRKIFLPAVVDSARSLHFIINPTFKTGYGYGWFVDESEPGKYVYHSGDNGGFRTYLFTIPASGYCIVLFANRDDINIETIAQKIYHIQFPAARVFLPVEELTN